MRSFVDDLPPALKADIIRISEENDDAFRVFQELHEHLTDVKRRKVVKTETSVLSETTVPPATLDSIHPGTVILQLRELSFTSPLRKKLNLTISIFPATQQPVLSISKSNDEKPELVISDFPNNITFATLLPVPEKPNMLYLVVFYKESSQSNVAGTEPIVMQLNKDLVRKQLLEGKEFKEGHDLVQFIMRKAAISGFKITETFNERDASFFVQAYRGTKEGSLYFLPNKIMFGFKKPILLFESHDVESISYSSITRNTFSLTVALKSGEKIEFSMIDQDEFAKIDDYVKRQAVQDMSMSEELKAKPMSKGQQMEGALGEATQQLGESGALSEVDDSDEEDDGDYEVGKEIDDTSDVSGDESEEGDSGGRSETDDGDDIGDDEDLRQMKDEDEEEDLDDMEEEDEMESE